MERLVKYLLIVACGIGSCMPLKAQLVRASSTSLRFESANQGQRISATSAPFYFSSRQQGKATAISPVLTFGRTEVASVPKPESPVQKQDQAIEKKNNPITSSTQTQPKEVTPSERKVEESKSPPVESLTNKPPGEELGKEYQNKIPDYYALIIGVSDYTFNGQGIESLQNPARDAEQLQNILTTQYNFAKDKVKLLKNATRQQIIDAFEWMAAELDSKDNLLVFYAGHGFYDKAKDFGYWLPSNARITSRSDWIPNSTVKDYLSAIKSKHTLLVTDACFAGSIFKTRAIDDYKTLKIYELYKYASRKALTSGNLSEVPDRSVFMEQILKNLAENEEEYLPAQRLFIRIYEPVTNNSSGDPKFGVIQGAGDEGGDFIFIKKKK